MMPIICTFKGRQALGPPERDQQASSVPYLCHSSLVENCLPPLGAELVVIPPEQLLESRVR